MSGSSSSDSNMPSHFTLWSSCYYEAGTANFLQKNTNSADIAPTKLAAPVINPAATSTYSQSEIPRDYQGWFPISSLGMAILLESV